MAGGLKVSGSGMGGGWMASWVPLSHLSSRLSNLVLPLSATGNPRVSENTQNHSLRQKKEGTKRLFP